LERSWESLVKLSDVESHMQKAVEATQRSFNTIRTGRANAAILDRVTVEYYGTPTPLKSLAGISTPDSSTINIQPYDRNSMGLIERAISLSDIGLTPNNDGTTIRLNIPPLTSDRRKELVKTAAKYAEEGKVSIRNIRRDAVDSVRKQEKAGDLPEDESRDLQDGIQKLTDKYISKVEHVTKEKETDIMTL
jgi:ribosome recycling factor